MNKIKDATVSVLVELILLIPSVVKNIVKRYRTKRLDRKLDEQV